ncbi:MAG: GTP-binding protein [Spirochaetia bacterium]
MIPLTLVVGYLGSGKSTLLNHILHSFPNRHVGVVVNEFGEIPLESSIIEPLNDSVRELRAGCLCCLARDDVVAAIDSLCAADPELEHIFVEASGDSDPVPVIQTLAAGGFREEAMLGAVVCVVDVTRYVALSTTNPLLWRGIAGADVVLLSKVDVVLPDAALEDIRHYAPQTPVLKWDSELNLAVVFERTSYDQSRIESLMQAYKAATVTHTLTPTFYRSKIPLNRDQIDTFFESLPPAVIRGKGFFAPAGPEGPYVKYIVQYTSGRYERYPRPWGRDELHESALLLLHDHWNEHELLNGIITCHPSDLDHDAQSQNTLRHGAPDTPGSDRPS